MKLRDNYNEDVAELVQPKVVDRSGGEHEIPIGQVLVNLGRGDVELVQDPALHERLVPRELSNSRSRSRMHFISVIRTLVIMKKW